ncbi:MAG: dihydrouridine synthase-domain-containing protein [Benjaminiella poitrasii]|nr:MAG: dihydrouridine synthase-domain-containing protein [Benjaminiella poitrasii]
MTLFQKIICRSFHSRLLRSISVAPMVDITAPPFLELLHIISGQDRFEYYTEMHHCQAVLHHHRHLHRFVGTPRPNVVVQLGGSDPVAMAQAARLLQDNGYHHVNINNGCPSPNVQHGQFGAVLMKEPGRVAAMIREMIDREGVTIPVTIKCRIGVDDRDDEAFLHGYVQTLLNVYAMPHLIVHARKCILKGLSPKQNRTVPPLNYERVYSLRQVFPDLPISINGGITTIDEIRSVLTKVDGCMIGRKIMNQPLFLQTIEQEIHGQQKVKPIENIIGDYLDYADRLYSNGNDDNSYGLPPATLMVKPLMSLFTGKQGRDFRRNVQKTLKPDTTPQAFFDIVTNAFNTVQEIK